MTNPTPNQSSDLIFSISESKLFAGKILTIIKVTKTVNTNPSQVIGSSGIIRDQKCCNGTGLEIIKQIVSYIWGKVKSATAFRSGNKYKSAHPTSLRFA